MINFRDLVLEFHKKNGHVHPGVPFPQPPEIGLLRARLIVEELGEFCEAVQKKDIVQVADALADLLYVVYGTAIAYGLSIETPVMPRVQGNPGLMVNGQMLSRLLELNVRVASVVASIHQVKANGESELGYLQMRLMLLSIHAVIIAGDCGIPIGLVFAEVHRSNMTKEPLDKHSKGGKGAGYVSPDIHGVLFGHR
jgi:predicted HAD superfamily Cof-like phosphohydrolase